MKVITVTLTTLILAAIGTEALSEIKLRCVNQEMDIRWPSYYNNADYYMCQKVGGPLEKMSCPDGQVFSFVLQVCTTPSKFIPPPPMDELPTAPPSAQSTSPMPWNPTQAVEPYTSSRPPAELPKPLMPHPGATHLPSMPHLPHLPNGPQPPTVDMPGNYNPTDINRPPYITDEQTLYQPNKPVGLIPLTQDISSIPPLPIAPFPQTPSVVKPPMPAGVNKPPMLPSAGSGSQKPTVKPAVPVPPTPAPTPPLVKVTTTRPAAAKPVKPVKPVKPSPPTPTKKVMPKVPVKVKQN